MKLYSESDLERWKFGSQTILPILLRKVGKRSRGDRLPKQFAMQFRDDAMIAIAEGDGSLALGCFLAALNFERQLWRELAEGVSENDTLESIQQMGCSPVITALILGRDLAIEVANEFLEASSHTAMSDETVFFGNFLLGLMNGKTGNMPDLQGMDSDLVSLANAVSLRDANMLEDAIVTGSNNWAEYVKADKGHTNSVCYQPGLAFTQLARELWNDGFRVDHFLVPTFILDSDVDESVGATFLF